MQVPIRWRDDKVRGKTSGAYLLSLNANAVWNNGSLCSFRQPAHTFFIDNGHLMKPSLSSRCCSSGLCVMQPWSGSGVAHHHQTWLKGQWSQSLLSQHKRVLLYRVVEVIAVRDIDSVPSERKKEEKLDSLTPSFRFGKIMWIRGNYSADRSQKQSWRHRL